MSKYYSYSIYECNKRVISLTLKLIIVLTIFVYSSCKSRKTNECLENYTVKEESADNPSLVILKKFDSNCKFEIQILCSVFEDNYIQTAILTKKNDKFILEFINPKTNPIILFNLSSEVNEQRVINIKPVSAYKKNFKSIFKVNLEQKLIDKSGLIYKFRVEDFIVYESSWFDAVYFVTSESGVIGSFFSKKSKSNEIIINPRGNICKDIIDYSKTEEGVFR